MTASSPFAGAGGALLRLDADGRIVDQSAAAAGLAALWADAPDTLLAARARAVDTGLPQEERATGDNNFWLLFIPEGADCLLVAHDTTFSDRVTEALLKSRSMLRQLLDGVVDLAFEVDADQRFTFVSPATAFGHKTEVWLGRSARSIFWPEGQVPARNPLATSQPQQFDAVPVAINGQDKCWLQFIMHPDHDEAGALVAVRGTCRDVTKRFLAERQTRLDNLRLALQQRITGLLNTKESAQDLLDSASKVLLDILRADTVWAVVKYDEGLVPISIEGTHHEILDLEGIWRSLDTSGPGVLKFQDDDGRGHLAIRLERGDVGLGMVVISRDAIMSPWSDQEEQLLGAVAGVLTAAFGKAELIDKLYRLSSKDELTALLNRRAFSDIVDRRLKHQARTGQAGCLLFIDLDHFKEVNDTLGHKAGDDALKMVADRLMASIRPCDYAGRYGGDEFVIWLEDVGPGIAAAKARILIDAMPGIRADIGDAGLRLSASVGIAASMPGLDMSFDALAHLADEALYQVKHGGKGDIAFARSKTAVGDET